MDIKELYWAAGFLEGEGAFHWRKAPHNQFSISANQNDPESLFRLKQHWGGAIYGPLKSKNPRAQLFFAWRLGGPAVASLAMMIYPLMTRRRQEKIAECLTEWRKVEHGPRYKTMCKRGHDLNDSRLTVQGSRDCRQCSRLRNRKYRAARKQPSEVQQPTVH